MVSFFVTRRGRRSSPARSCTSPAGRRTERGDEREHRPTGTRPGQGPAPHPDPAADRIVTLPNALSALRLVLVPVFFWLVLTRQRRLGARRTHGQRLHGLPRRQARPPVRQVSRLGQLLDPAADRLYILATLVGLAWRDVVPWWLRRGDRRPRRAAGVHDARAGPVRVRPAARCTSSARPPRSACSTPSRCCCSPRSAARWPRCPGFRLGVRLVGDGPVLVGRWLYLRQVREVVGAARAEQARPAAGPAGVRAA